MEPQTPSTPDRLVDSHNRGWMPTTDGNYRCFDPTAYGQQTVVELPLGDIGPVRPVQSYTSADREQLATAFEQAGRRMIGSLAAALEQVHHAARNRAGDWRRDPAGTANYAQRTLTAGRPGSWESEVLLEVVWFGNELNLHPNQQRRSVEYMRSTGPNRIRVDVAAREAIAEVLTRWTCSTARYTEVAENLAGLVAAYADQRHGPNGWNQIADQWLQPGARLRSDGFRPCYRLLYGGSAHFSSESLA